MLVWAPFEDTVVRERALSACSLARRQDLLRLAGSLLCFGPLVTKMRSLREDTAARLLGVSFYGDTEEREIKCI